MSGRLLNVAAAAALLAGASTILQGCGDVSGLTPAAVPDGDAARGRVLVRAYGCGTCHVVPEVPGAIGNVGPPLTGLSRQAYVAGVLPNLPQNLVEWIQDPLAVDPRTAMPDMGVSEAEARDIAAFLYSVGDERS